MAKDAFNYWEKELQGIMTAGPDDRVKLQLRTAHTATKWLSLTPEDFEAVEALLIERYAARLAAGEEQ